MRAMILAAGLGQRMRPLTDAKPKPLLEAGGSPLIDYHLHALARTGFERVVINVHHLADQVIAHVGQGERFGIEVVFSYEDELLETAGGIHNALPLLGEAPFAVINGDIFTDYDLGQLPRELDGRLGHLVMVDNPPWHPRGDFALDASGTLGLEGERLTYAGISVYDPALFEGLASGPAKLITLYEPAVAAGQFGGEHFRGKWHDVGTPERLAALNASLR